MHSFRPNTFLFVADLKCNMAICTVELYQRNTVGHSGPTELCLSTP